jgi:hypothetical protein
VPVRCATQFIAGARLDRRLQRFGGRGSFAYEAVFTGIPDLGMQHVAFGGQRRRINDDGGAEVGLTQRLGFHGGVRVEGRTTVDGAPAVVLVPRGARAGLNSGHVIVAWNAPGAAYFASVHFDRLPFARRVATARALAASVERTT